ncbi:MAG: hypothetical protein RR646_01710 [Erysipelotrichaceae bacterium]
MKNKLKSILVTLLLLLLLLSVLAIFNAMFIVGPTAKYDSNINTKITNIETKYKVSNVYRHVFRYSVFIGETKEDYIFFDDNETKLLTVNKTEVDVNKAKLIALDKGFSKACSIQIGYGYDNAAYIIEENEHLLVLDIKSYKELYYKGGGKYDK